MSDEAQPPSEIALLTDANSVKLEFQEAVLRRLLDAGIDCDLAFEAVTNLRVTPDNNAVIPQLAADYANYLVEAWNASSTMVRGLLARTSDAHKMPRFTMLVFQRLISSK